MKKFIPVILLAVVAMIYIVPLVWSHLGVRKLSEDRRDRRDSAEAYLVHCQVCKGKVSSYAAKCPHCGNPRE